jgi:DNA-binding NtrC family response regulator
MVHFIPTGQRKLAILAAQADHAPVLISGGSGTGKGAIAKWIHKNSPRSNRPFVEMKIERPLAEQIIAANGGTLLIPEIAELPRSAQLQLVEFLRTKTVPHPLNPSMKMLAHARVIATNNHPLESRAAAGLFNTDLVESFSEFQIHCLQPRI